MKAPRDLRWENSHNGGVMMIKICNACDLDCRACTAAVGLAKKHHRVWFMTPDQFRIAIRSMAGWTQTIALFGGNPCISPHFAEICSIFAEEWPNKEQRALWSNNLFGKVSLCRETFEGRWCNLNVHRNRKAFDEIWEGWPEARKINILKNGLKRPSMHGSWWVALKDLVPDEAERWELIGKCFVNQQWSAMISLIRGELRAFFCEFAATQAEFADLEGQPDLGLSLTPGWWNHGIEHYADQIRHYCHRCGAPLNPQKIEDLGGGAEDFTQTHSPVFLTIKGRPNRLVTDREEVEAAQSATSYL